MAYIDTKHFYKCETCNNFIEESWCDVPCVNYEFYSPNISKIPTADVVEVKHGYWIETNEATICSVCKIDNDIYEAKKLNYCPNCGAKMGAEGGAE